MVVLISYIITVAVIHTDKVTVIGSVGVFCKGLRAYLSFGGATPTVKRKRRLKIQPSLSARQSGNRPLIYDL